MTRKNTDNIIDGMRKKFPTTIFQIDPDLKRLFKSYCARENKPMVQVVEELMKEKLKKERVKNGN